MLPQTAASALLLAGEINTNIPYTGLSAIEHADASERYQ
jgi:hypothetical protein